VEVTEVVVLPGEAGGAGLVQPGAETASVGLDSGLQCLQRGHGGDRWRPGSSQQCRATG